MSSSLDLATMALLALAGLVAGVLNTLAGGGSLLVVPMLIFAGLPETTANGTSRIALVFQNATAVTSYARAGQLDWRAAARVLPPLLVGAGLGAYAGASLADELFRDILAWVMLAVALLVIFDPQRRMRREVVGAEDSRRRLGRWQLWLVFVGVGAFGGMIQAGVGFLVLGALTLLAGMDLVRANALKVLLILAYTPLALGMFVLEGKVDWLLGLMVAGGQALGGWLGAAAAIERGEPLIRAFLAAAVVLTALHLLGVDAWLSRG